MSAPTGISASNNEKFEYAAGSVQTPAPSTSHLLRVPAPLTPISSVILYYIHKLESSPALPPCLAAVAALSAAVAHYNIESAREAVDLLDSLATTLRKTLNNPLPARAGIDAFLELIAYIPHEGSELPLTPKFIMQTAEQYVKDGLAAREMIIDQTQHLIKGNMTFLIPALDDITKALLITAAKDQTIEDFRVLFLASKNQVTNDLIDEVTKVLFDNHRDYTIVDGDNLGHAIFCIKSYGKFRHSVVLSGAEAVNSTGEIYAPRGTLTMAIIAKEYDIEFYVLAESNKLLKERQEYRDVEKYGAALPWQNNPRRSVMPPDFVFNKTSYREPSPTRERNEREAAQLEQDKPFEAVIEEHARALGRAEIALDMTPSNLITRYYTENGMLTRQDIQDEWYELWGDMGPEDVKDHQHFHPKPREPVPRVASQTRQARLASRAVAPKKGRPKAPKARK